MTPKKLDIWQQWNQYLCDRSEHLSRAVPKIYSDCYASLYSMMQEEITRAVYEWNWLQFQKLFSDWQDQWVNLPEKPQKYFPSNSR